MMKFPHTMTIAQSYALAYVCDVGYAAPEQIVKRTNMAPAVVTQAVMDLRADGLVSLDHTGIVEITGMGRTMTQAVRRYADRIVGFESPGDKKRTP